MSIKKKKAISWRMDFDFYSYEITVKAKTKGEARKKAMAKMARVPLSKFINKHGTFLDKDD